MVSFEEFLQRSRKSNGEKYLSKTIEIYLKDITRFWSDLKLDGTFEELIESMNVLITKYPSMHLKATFRMFLIYSGMDKDDDRLNSLKSPHKVATALTSPRMLSQRVISIDDYKHLFQSVNDDWKLILGFLYDTCARESEMLNTRVRDIRFLNPPEGKFGAEVRLLGKGGKKRTVYLTIGTTTLLKPKIINKQLDDKIFVFHKPDGTLYKRQEKVLIDGMRNITQKHIGQTHTPHHIRHTSPTHKADIGANIEGIASYLGHSKISTSEIYIKTAKFMGKKMAQKYAEDITDATHN